MQTTVEETAKHTVKLTVEVPPEEFQRDLDKAYRHVGAEVKIPGFRKGKIPKKILDVQVGKAAVYEHFLRDFLPEYYLKAVREHQLAPIGDPDIDLGGAVEEGKPLVFTAVVEVRPRLELGEDGYKDLTVQRPSAQVGDEEVDEQIERLRERFAELAPVGRPAQTGDFVIADIRGSIHDEEIADATGLDVLYEVGTGGLVDKLDEELLGKRPGDILKFNAVLPERFGERAGQEVTFNVLVKEVKEKVLPDGGDEFAKTASEFDTLDELREDIRGKMQTIKAGQADAAVRDLVLQEMVDRIDVDLPETLIDQETERRVENARERAQRQGASLEDALAAGGMDELQFRSDARLHAIRAIKADLVLESVARAEGLEATGEDLDREVVHLAEAMGRPPKEVAKALEKSKQVTQLAGDIIRTKALDVLVEHANVVSEAASEDAPPESQAASETSGPEPDPPTDPPAVPAEEQGAQDE
jgi:trigger factor